MEGKEAPAPEGSVSGGILAATGCRERFGGGGTYVGHGLNSQKQVEPGFAPASDNHNFSSVRGSDIFFIPSDQ